MTLGATSTHSSVPQNSRASSRERVRAFAKAIYEVEPEPRSLAALERLAGLPNTTVAALSGRHLEGLKRVFPLREPVLLGGSHGAESSWQDSSLSPEAQAHLDRKEAEIRELMERFPAHRMDIHRGEPAAPAPSA